jgi:hypothetical protein
MAPDSGAACEILEFRASRDVSHEEHAAVTAAIWRAIEQDRFPLAPRLEPLRSALAKLDPAAAAALRRPPAAKSAKSAEAQPKTPKAAHEAPEAVLARELNQPPRQQAAGDERQAIVQYSPVPAKPTAACDWNETSSRSFSAKWPHGVGDV